MYELFVEDRQQLRLLAWRPRRQGALRGHADIELAIGLQILDVPVWEHRQVVCAGLPSKPLTRAGRHLKDDRGAYVWARVLAWRSQALADSFAWRVGELVLRRHPGDFDRGGRG